jgi:thymidylate synthase (FAD)
MNVTTVQSTPKPEQLVCTAARGDYYDGFVGDVEYDELMAAVPFENDHVETVEKIFDDYYRGNRAADPRYGYHLEATGHAEEYVDDYEGLNEVYAKQYALLERLFRRGHFGPYEHPQITLAVEGVSRSCMAQITRHRHATFDVQSQRYVDFSEKDDPVVVPKSLTAPDHATRGAGPVNVIDREGFSESFEELSDTLVEQYELLVDAGVPKEDARFILPIGTKVNFTVSVNARMLLHIEDMRKTGEAQWEIREMTEMIHDEFAAWMPMTAHLYEEHGPHKIAP